jgi:hypothetical protein
MALVPLLLLLLLLLMWLLLLGVVAKSTSGPFVPVAAQLKLSPLVQSSFCTGCVTFITSVVWL